MTVPARFRFILPLLLLTVPAAAAPRPTVTLSISGDDGSRLASVDATDVSVSVSRSVASPDAADKPGDKPGQLKADDVSNQMSVMMDSSVLSNAAFLSWAGQGARQGSLQVTVQGGVPATYVATDLSSWSLSVTQSSSGMDAQVSLSVTAKHLTINGTKVN